MTTSHAATVAAIVERNRGRGCRLAWRLGSRDPEDTVQDASLILWRKARISPDTADQDGLFVVCIREAVLHQWRHDSWKVRAGTTARFATVPQYLLPRSPSAESVVMAGLIEERLVVGLRRMTPYHRGRLARRVARGNRVTEPFLPAVRALERQTREVA